MARTDCPPVTTQKVTGVLRWELVFEIELINVDKDYFGKMRRGVGTVLRPKGVEYVQKGDLEALRRGEKLDASGMIEKNLGLGKKE